MQATTSVAEAIIMPLSLFLTLSYTSTLLHGVYGEKHVESSFVRPSFDAKYTRCGHMFPKAGLAPKRNEAYATRMMLWLMVCTNATSVKDICGIVSFFSSDRYRGVYV